MNILKLNQMKHTNLIVGILTLVMFTFLSCEHMDDYHFEYIKDGEIQYTTRLDSVVTFAGDSRVMISGILDQPFGVEQIRVYYNNGLDSLFMDYQQINTVDTISIMLDNMEEKSYGFDIYTADGKNNKSVKVMAFGTAYGERFRSNLFSRVIDADSTRDGSIYLTWLPADEMERGTEIKYLNSSGSEVILNLPEDSTWVALTDFSEGMSFRSSLVPELTSLDTFLCDWTDIELQIYESQGLFVHPILGDTPYNFDKVVRTVGANSYETYFADQEGNREGTRMKLKVDEENNVDVTFVGSTYVIEPNGVSTYNPSTGLFTLNYKYDWTLGERTITETLTLK